MNHRQRPRKKRRVWLLVVGGLLLAGGSWFICRALFDKFQARSPESPVSAVAEPVVVPPVPSPSPPPPPPTVAQAVEGPQVGKARQPIFDRNMGAMAVSFKQASVYIKPLELEEGQKAVVQLAALLGLSTEKLKVDLQTERDFFWLKRNLSADTAQKIAKSNFSGVYLVDELQRYYPLHDHAAHVVGFVKDELGLAGAEFIYDPILRGNRALIAQYLSLPGLEADNIPDDGAAVVLSIDIDLQVLLEKKLHHLMQQTAAKSASGVLIETGSGEILALAEAPDYDPNMYWKASNSAHKNKLLSESLPIAGLNAFIKAAAELAAGNLPPELTSREEEAARIILPRVMKIVKGEVPIPKSQESQVWQPGIHLSPPFQWPLGFTQEGEVLTSFCAKLGLSASGTGLAESHLQVGGDQPKKESSCALNDETWRAPALNILAAFSQLTNGGKAISPHLLRGIWLRDNGTFHPTTFPVAEAIGLQASVDFVRFIESLLPPGPGDDLILESIRSMAKETVREQGRIRDNEVERTVEDAFRFSVMTLAGGRRQGTHQLALLLVVDGAKMNLNLPSPFRSAAAEIVSQGNGLMAKRWSNEVKAPKLESDAALHQKWSQSQTLDPSHPLIDSIVNQEMPDLIGMSLRKAMQALQGYSLKVNVQGAGRVTRQSPASGARLKGVTETTLELHMDN